MSPEQFVYWLQGFMEVANPSTLDERQVQEIKNHLAEVFHKVTPTITVDGTKKNPEPVTWPWDKPGTGIQPFNWPPSGEIFIC